MAENNENLIHPFAVIEPGAAVGSGTRVGAWAHLLSGAKAGSGCEIGDHAFLDGASSLGDRVYIGCGAKICGNAAVGDNADIGPGAIIDGRNAPVRIGRHAAVAPGAVVTQNVPPFAIVEGNPAQIAGYANATAAADTGTATGAKLRNIPKFSDLRGDLNVLEFDKFLPFQVKRIFYTYAVKSEVRGEHAHKLCEQFMVAVCGSVHVIVDDASSREEFVLDSPSVGLHLPAGLWGVQYKHSADCVLLVLASHPYDADDYIRDYDGFLKYKGR